MNSASGSSYFALQASWGVTKHLGGRGATDELARLCLVHGGSRVLVVGCGVGTSACYLAARLQAKVVGVDISPAMVRRSAGRARKKGLTETARFLVGSGTALPFDDGSFDVVLSESVNSFIPDRERALSEYRRVAKPGGTVGMNECVWLESPPGDLAAYLERVTGARFIDAEEKSWSRLLEQCGFDAVSEHIHRTGILQQWCSEVRHVDAHEFADAWGSFVRGCFSNPGAYRSFLRTALKVPGSAGRMFRYFGYGIYIGHKPEVDAAGRV